MAVRIVPTVLVAVAFVFFVTRANADPPRPDLTATRVESLTAQVRGLFREQVPSYPDPWTPRRERPKQVRV